MMGALGRAAAAAAAILVGLLELRARAPRYHGGVMTGHSTALSVGRTKHFRERQPCSGVAEIRIRPGEMRMGQTGDCARAGMVKALRGRLRMGLWV